MVHSIGNSTNPIEQNAKAAAKERIKNAQIKTWNDVENLRGSSVNLWGNEIIKEEQMQQSYTSYSIAMLKEYYDLNKDGKVTVEELAEKEKEAAIQANDMWSIALLDETVEETQNSPELVELFDSNGDGKLTKEEFLNGQSAFWGKNFDLNGDGKVSEEEYFEVNGDNEINKTTSTRLSNLFAENLDMNEDGTIDAKEMAFFNSVADEIDGQKDGKITHAGESAMVGAVTGMNASNPEYNRVVNKYLSGETLTTEEQQILKESQSTIRGNMRKAAGINIEG